MRRHLAVTSERLGAFFVSLAAPAGRGCRRGQVWARERARRDVCAPGTPGPHAAMLVLGGSGGGNKRRAFIAKSFAALRLAWKAWFLANAQNEPRCRRIRFPTMRHRESTGRPMQPAIPEYSRRRRQPTGTQRTMARTGHNAALEHLEPKLASQARIASLCR